ncbi:MAG: hypothetical protein CMC35_05765 [Flavobacteriaceae bacterium]|nr:hypothetical protein [Flavobacteriaceae bacterium]|tara:strand:+ start:38505 stop:39071 length:567 start_codon:yes stop_codon:yes gene_type:complete
MGNIHNIYLIKALEAYPWELEKAVEALNYALSYEPDNATALVLMAKIHAEYLGDYEVAKELFEKALISDLNNPKIYPEYITVLVHAEDFKEATRLIEYAMTVKGVDRAVIKLLHGHVLEATLEFEKAEEAIKEAMSLALNNGFIEHAELELNRVRKKRERAKRQTKIEEKSVEETKNTGWLHRLNGLL